VAALRANANRWPIIMGPVILALQEAGFTGATAMAAELNRCRIAPQRAGEWTAWSVRNLLDRIKDTSAR
jgi:hypothetical protein